ncbi:GSCOCG00013536001-RA-CDS [Cotesia congregata]|uniref:Uncharacterized protein n=1 Tax=Cotesia congregata TaxID=51543 RepID=A0A8J2H426_COTCN|nr:GSCOCG00013536001-RA-CDS [Cotesia congregata]CAG5076030.1 Protein of unknown function [Cotesia congregata]
MLFFVIISLLVFGSSATIVGQGPCPNITGVVVDFNKMVGRWYQYAYTFDPYNDTLKCITYKVTTPKNDRPRMFATAISKSTGSMSAVESEIILNHQPRNGMNVITHVPLIGELTSHQYRDLEVVPDSYEISWNCRSQGSNNVQTFGLYTRSPNPSVDVIRRARQLALEKGLAIPNFVKFDNNCYSDKCICL